MPINVATVIDENDSVFKMAEILGKLDYRKLHSSYHRWWRKIELEVMFSIIVYAFSNERKRGPAEGIATLLQMQDMQVRKTTHILKA